MIRSTLRAAAAALLVVLALAGCSPDSRPVARVGRHTLTVGDFVRAARRAGGSQQLPAEQARPLLLREMVRNELLLVAAESHGLDTTVFTRNHRRAVTEQTLVAALAAQLAPADPGVTQAEARTLHDWRRTRSDVQLVFAPDSAVIELARRRIAAGTPISQVADELGGASGLPPGGRLGFRLPGSLPQPLDDAMRTLPVGQLGGPYHAPMGWFLVRVARRAPATVLPFEQERAALENLVRQRKRQGTIIAGVDKLGTEYHLSVAADAGPALFRVLTPGRVGGLGDMSPGTADRAQLLATFDGGTLTLGDAWDDLNRNEVSKPNTSVVPALREWVRERAIVRIAMAEARRRHLDEDPAVAGPLADEIDDYILRGEYENVVAGVAPPDEATLRATWEPVKDRFPMLREAHVLWAAVSDTAKAMSIGERSGRGSLREVARGVDPAIVVHEETVRFPNASPDWTQVQGELQQLEPGQWAGPRVTAAGFRWVQLVDKAQGPLSWDQLPMEARQSLANNLLQRTRDERVAAFTDSVSRAVNPVLLPEALRRVPWPVPAGGTR